MKKVLTYFTIILISNINFSVFGQENNDILKHNYIVGLAVAKGGVDKYPISGMFYAGYERNLFQPGNMCYLALEARIRGGLIFWRDHIYPTSSGDKQVTLLYIDDYLIGTSLLPRFYFQITEDCQLFLDGEIGGIYQYIRTSVSPTPGWDKTGDVFTPAFGLHIGAKSGRLSLWAGLFTTDSKSKTNKLLPQNVQVHDNIEFEAGFGFYF